MEKKQPERVVMNVDDLIKIVIDETVLELSEEENAALQTKHDEEMAKRFGFDSYNQLKQYLEICQSNPDWAETYGYGGFLINQKHIEDFKKDSIAFATEVVDYKRDTPVHGAYFGPTFIRPGIYSQNDDSN